LPPRSLVDCGVRHDPTAPANPAPAPSAPPLPTKGKGKKALQRQQFHQPFSHQHFHSPAPPAR
jgi:hypothetical protein